MFIDATRLLDVELMRARRQEYAWPGAGAGQVKLRLETERSGGCRNLVGDAGSEGRLGHLFFRIPQVIDPVERGLGDFDPQADAVWKLT